MMDAAFEALVISCLDALDRGEPIDDILRHYPAQAAELQLILDTARRLDGLDLAPSRAAEAASRRSFLTEAAQIRAADPRPSPGTASPAAGATGQGEHGRFAWLGRSTLAMAAMTAAVVMMIVVSISASASALPGDGLYTLKRSSERIQLVLATDAAAETALRDAFNRRRIDEANALLAAGREAEVDFIGTAEAAGDRAWRVDGVLAYVDDSTQILGDLAPGELVHVRGRASGGRLVLGTVICLDDLPHWSPESGPLPDVTVKPAAPTPLPFPTAVPATTVPITAPSPAGNPTPAAPLPGTGVTHPAATAEDNGSGDSGATGATSADEEDGEDGDDRSGSGKDDDDDGNKHDDGDDDDRDDGGDDKSHDDKGDDTGGEA